jgi:outer membrane protein
MCILMPVFVAAQGADDARSGLSAGALFSLALEAETSGRAADSEAIYKALLRDPDVEVRSEARFRYGKLLSDTGQLTEAAVQFRALLDEKPDAQRVRLELAGVLARMGDMRAAGRAMRQAQAGGLPPDVAQLVSQFQGALRSLRPYGGSFEVALAPSSNINRATSATTLDTIIAPFELSDDARAQSGIGLKLGGQAYLHIPFAKQVRLTTRLSTQASLYREKRFGDVVSSAEAGLELVAGKSVFRPLIGRSYRWYGGSLYATTNTATLEWQRALGKRSQIEANVGIGWANYRTNDLQDGRLYDASVSFEHAFTNRSGIRLSVNGQRQTAADPGYASVSGGGSALFYREMGGMTAFASAGLSRLEADQRLFLFPRRRTEWSSRLSAGATLRQLKIAGFAPVARVSYERTKSSVALYDFRRFAAEIGLTRAF